MGVDWNYYTGHVYSIIPTLRRAVGQYLRSGYDYKIGLTGDPDRRWREAHQSNWERMIVIYNTKSVSYCAIAEDLLIKDGWERYLDRSWNEVGGGGGAKEGLDEYFVYILLG